MMTRLGPCSRHFIACAFAVAVLWQPALAQTVAPTATAAASATPLATATSAPTATPAPAAPGFTALAHATATFVTSGRTVTGSIQLGVDERPGLVRIDLLALKTDAMPLPPLKLTAIVDRRANTVTLWNDLTRRYYVQSISSLSRHAAPSPRPSRAPAPSRSRTFLSDLDLLTLTMKLTGHTVTNGVPTTGLSFDLMVAKKGESVPIHISALTQIIDQSAGFPMTLELTVEREGSPLHANFSYAVDTLKRGLPAPSRFGIPTGYVKASSMWAVLQKS